MAPLLSELSRATTGKLRLCFSVPPRHGKSETLLHFLAWLLWQNPRLRLLYVTHTATFAARQSKAVRRLAKAAGVELREGSNRADEWETTSDGGLTARGVGGEITGRGFDVIVVDDPIKNTAMAESALQRDSMATWFERDAFSRLTPTGSIVVVHTRWHVDDLIGRLSGSGFQRLNLPAINESGQALWPGGGWTVDVLEERHRRVGEYGWASLYQGQPRPKGGTVFGPAHFYKPDELPTKGYTLAHGLDLAYTAKTQSDWSVCWTMLRAGDLLYVVDVRREQVQAPDFADTLTRQAAHFPGRFRWYGSTTEIGAGQLLGKFSRLHISALLAKGDKFLRAQPLAAAWNAGRVLLPAGPDDMPAPDWVEAVVSEFGDFTGVGDRHDDLIDAAAACFDELQATASAKPSIIYRDPDARPVGW